MPQRARLATIGIAAPLLIGLGCSSGYYTAAADREVAAILAHREAMVLGDRAAHVITPDVEAPPAAQPQQPPSVPPETQPAGELDLWESLALAVSKNRDYQSRREALYRQGLGYSLARFNFGPQFRATLGHVWSDAEDQGASHRLDGLVGVSKILPTGGRLTVDSGLGSGWNQSRPHSDLGAALFDSTLFFGVSQPLLRGAGYEVSHEALTQAERSLVYAIRDFELYREDFVIGIARSFFDLVSQRQTLDNEEANLRQAVFDREQAEALLEVDRSTEVEVYRARRREIDAENRLLDARAAFERARDQFKIQLGIPTAETIKLVAAEPPFESVRLEADSAVRAAIHNRLDLITERERIADAERSVRIAENALLPRLDLTATLGYTGDPDSSLHDAAPDRWNASAGILLEIPLQQLPERNNLRSAQLSLDQAQRNYTLLLDNIELEIKNQLRSLRSLEQQIELQQGQIVQERRAVTVTEIRYEAGDLDNRDLLEARQALFNAQNALIRLQVDHFIGRLRLLRDLGLLFVDEEGMWR